MDRIYQRAGRGNLAPFVDAVNIDLLGLGEITVPAFTLSSDSQGNYSFTMAYREGGTPVALFGAQDTLAPNNPSGTIDALNTALSAQPEYLGLGVRSLTAVDSNGLMVRRVVVLASLGTPGVLLNGSVPLQWGVIAHPTVAIPPGAEATVTLMTSDPSVFAVGHPVVVTNKGGADWEIDTPLWVYFDQGAGAWYGFADCCVLPGGP